MNAVNTEFYYDEVWFTDQSSKALEIEDNKKSHTNSWIHIIKM